MRLPVRLDATAKALETIERVTAQTLGLLEPKFSILAVASSSADTLE